MLELDVTDRRVLLELDRNARQSISTLARKIRQGRDKVEYRYNRLLERGIITGFVAEVDNYCLGYSLFKTYLRLEYNKSKVQELIKYLSLHPRVYWMAECDGSWDLIVIMTAADTAEFYALHSEMLSKHTEVVLNFAAYSMVEHAIYSRNYLYPGARTVMKLGGSLKRVLVDDDDLRIMTLLAKDARMSTALIADRISKGTSFTEYRIRRLEDEGIIKGYRAELNLAALGLVMFKAQFYLRSYELGLKEQFKAYCLQHPNVVFYIEQIGDVNVEIELEVERYEDYCRVIDQIRSQFSKLIRNFSTMLIRKVRHSPIPPTLISQSI